jgi:hypothetical protein
VMECLWVGWTTLCLLLSRQKRESRAGKGHTERRSHELLFLTCSIMACSIAIIGGGAAGLVSLKVLLETEECRSGLWVPTLFEARDAIGGVWCVSNDQSSPYTSFTTSRGCLLTRLTPIRPSLLSTTLSQRTCRIRSWPLMDFFSLQRHRCFLRHPMFCNT